MPNSGYKINGNDLQGTYNIRVKKINGLFQFLARKGETSYSWLDSDGEETFTTSKDIKFEGRDIYMFGLIIADTRTLFFQKLDAFKVLLQSSGLKTLAVPYIDITFSLMYVKGSDLTMLSKWKSNKYAGEFWVQFREPNPLKTYY